MPLTTKKTTPTGNSFKSFILPVYVLLSLIFIAVVSYNYLAGFVYNSWVSQGAVAGQQQWYERAVIDVMNQVVTQCEPVALTAWDQQVDIVNYACVQPQTELETSQNPSVGE